MKALYFEGKLALREVEKPRPATGEALIQVLLAGICGTDRQILKGYSAFRGIPGHEFVGRVVQCDDTPWVGRRVVGEINLACGSCAWCQRGLGRHCPHRAVMGIANHPGTFAEFLTLPVANLHEVPDAVPDEAAAFTEPVAAAAEILEQIQIPAGMRVAVLGDGRLGLLIAQVLRHAQAEVTVIGRHAAKLEVARSWGFQTIDLMPRSRRATAGDFGAPVGEGKMNSTVRSRPPERFALVVEATGSPQGVEEALRLVEPRGTVVMKSTFFEPARFDTAKLVVDEITLLGSRCGNFNLALDLLCGKHVDVQSLVSKIFPLEAGLEAFEYLNRDSCLKVLLAP